MFALAIDTAGPFCSAAVCAPSDPVRPLAAESEEIGRGHAERLMPMIESVLARAGHGYDEIGLIAVTTGPGSFTGLRIGISAARGLALALSVPARGSSVLDVLAQQAFNEMNEAATAVVALDAGRGDLFIQAVRGAERAPVLAASRLSISEAAQGLAMLSGRIGLIGSGAPALADTLGTSIAPELIGDADHVDCAILASMAFAGAGVSPPRPLYLRAPDAKPQAGKAVARA